MCALGVTDCRAFEAEGAAKYGRQPGEHGPVFCGSARSRVRVGLGAVANALLLRERQWTAVEADLLGFSRQKFVFRAFRTRVLSPMMMAW